MDTQQQHENEVTQLKAELYDIQKDMQMSQNQFREFVAILANEFDMDLSNGVDLTDIIKRVKELNGSGETDQISVE